jgi:VWFA-related protein
MHSALVLALLLTTALTAAHAQQPEAPAPSITVSTTLVEVPATVKTKDGENVFALTAGDFLLTDNGAPQRITLVPDTDSQPLALAIVVQTGGAGARHLADYQDLGTILEALIGNVDHTVAVIGFDSTPHLLLPFTSSTDDDAAQLSTLQPGNPGAAILDALAFAVAQLQTAPPNYRRAILLLGETIDQGSTTTLDEALRLISDTNTIMYSFGFSSTHAAVSHEASKFNRPDEPGPVHGCFSREGADAEYDGHYSKQVLDCIGDLAPPLRFATMAFLTARNSLHTNTAESTAQLSGGEFFHFHDAKSLRKGLIAVSNDVPNFYILSFHPTAPTPGLHALRLELKNRPNLRLAARTEYWIDNRANPSPP